MRKIVIPTDFSDNAFNAIRYAMEVFKYDRSEFIVVHAYADTVYENTLEMSRAFFEEFKQKTKAGAEKLLKELVDKMRSESPNPRHLYQYHAHFGSLVDTINEMVNDEDVDLVVMGTKGKTDDRSITFGSMTMQVIKYVKCPVFAIPKDYHDRPPQEILFPTNFMVPYKRREMKLVSTLAKHFAAQLHFLYQTKGKSMSYRQHDNKSFLECCVDENFVHFHEITGDDLVSGINGFIKKNNINMLVMVNSQHSFLDSVLRSDTIEKIGLEIEIPFLVLQNLPR